MRSSKRSFAPWSARILLLALLSKRGLVKRGAGLTRPATRCAKHLVATNGHLTAQPVAVLQDLSRGSGAEPHRPRYGAGTRRPLAPRDGELLVSRRDDGHRRALHRIAEAVALRDRGGRRREKLAPPRATLALNASTQDVAQLADSHKLGRHYEHPDQEEAARCRHQLGVLCHLPQLVEGRTSAAQGLCQGPLLPQGRRRERGRRRGRDRGNVPVAALGCVEIKSGASRHRRNIATSSARWRGDSTPSTRPNSLFDFHTGTRKASTRSWRSSLSTYGRSGRRRPEKSWRRRATARRRPTPSSRPSSTSRTRACSGG